MSLQALHNLFFGAVSQIILDITPGMMLSVWSCRGREICAKCGSNEHFADICKNTLCCSNCESTHAVFTRVCPLWKQEILSLKAKENITYLEALKRCSFLAQGSYADVALLGPAPRTESKATQVSLEDMAVALKTPKATQRQQAPALRGAGSPAAPTSQDSPAPAASVQSARSLTGEQKRGSRPHSLERPQATKELHGSHGASVAQKEAEEMDGCESLPSTSAVFPSGSGRGHGLGSRSSDPPSRMSSLLAELRRAVLLPCPPFYLPLLLTRTR
ncbi:hypothetical protein HPB47_017534 [Ixodes persulcatus]|uniref:Uncharacterized protein n=1 Tax=Ixodes persulcatus TaxID=34615 RepID=A0AC60QN26_IXOPE|nr:hypothetical protein HPB47_017534 [Ixodes persulcatus]